MFPIPFKTNSANIPRWNHGSQGNLFFSSYEFYCIEISGSCRAGRRLHNWAVPSGTETQLWCHLPARIAGHASPALPLASTMSCTCTRCLLATQPSIAHARPAYRAPEPTRWTHCIEMSLEIRLTKAPVHTRKGGDS